MGLSVEKVLKIDSNGSMPMNKMSAMSIFVKKLKRLKNLLPQNHDSLKLDCLVVLRFYGPVNPLGSCRARSVYLTTRLLGRLSPLSG